MLTRRTACNRDCPDACSLLVSVDEHGRAVRLKGDPQDPVTRGFLCERTSRFLSRQYAADRLTHPLLYGQPVSWDTALDAAAEKLTECQRRYGAESVLHYRSGGSLGILKLISDYLFRRWGPVTVKHGDICSGAGEAAQQLDFGCCDSHDLFDLHNSRSILIWGKNIHTSGVHLLPVLLEARRRGARLAGVDVVRTRVAELCDLFVQPRPGGDFALAMGVARVLFERGLDDPEARGYCDHYDEFRALACSRDWAPEAGVTPEEIEKLALLYGQNKPGCIQVGWGLARRGNGAASVRALDALGAISGNLGVPGGGVSYYFKRRDAFDSSPLGSGSARSLPEALLGRAILEADPPIRCIWVTAGNPVSMLPDSASVKEAFARSEFTVVVDTHPTDTTDVAHLVLPTLTLLEDDDIVGAYGNHYLRASSPAVEPPGEARHELWIWQQLARRLGLGELLEGTPREWKRRLLRPEIALEEVERGPVRNPRAQAVLFQGRRFPTPSGRVNLLREAPPNPVRLTPEFPLSLLAVSVPQAQSSQWSVPVPSPPEVRVHPSAANGCADGALARVESRRGHLVVRVRHDPSVHPQVLFTAKGGMLRQGACANLLVEARETDEGGGAAFYDEPVRLTGVPEPSARNG